MGFLGFGKRRDEVVDLRGYYKDKRVKENKERASASDKNELGFLNNLASSSSSSMKNKSSDLDEDAEDSSGSAEDKRKRLAKRLIDMTNRIEDLNSQVYHLQQRVELLEKKGTIRS